VDRSLFQIIHTLEAEQIFLVFMWNLHAGAGMQTTLRIQHWHIFTWSGNFLGLEANSSSCLRQYYTVALNILWTLRSVPVTLKRGSTYFIFFPKSKCLKWHEGCSIELWGLTVWSWELIHCALIYAAEVLMSASLRHKLEDYVQSMQPNLVQPCPCRLLGIATDAFRLPHSGLRALS